MLTTLLAQAESSTTSCASVRLVHTNMPPSASASVLEIYSDIASAAPLGPRPELDSVTIGQRLSAAHGGFWDVFAMGAAFSYSIYCISYVELSGEYWTVLLCQESVDEWANDCGQDGLYLYSNGSMPSLSQHEWFLPQLEYYKHYQLADSVKDEHVRKAIDIVSSFNPKQVNNSWADEIRREAESSWPSDYWNVVVEFAPGVSYFYCDEQIHLTDQRLSDVKLTIFDRMCQSPTNEGRVLRHSRPRHATMISILN
ncbi:hypothetical protein AB1Y20_008634 [Prymnesium parvum]|uniref:Uncharacterized protein n=1 Tax=Prymnesium parvum TaxID=97485 RepID=A0AB34ITM7_PRYPA